MIFGNTEIAAIDGRIFWREAQMPGRRWHRTPFADGDFASLEQAGPAVVEYRDRMFAPTDLEERAAAEQREAADAAQRAADKAARLQALAEGVPTDGGA